jgi:hypothetical protein
MKKIYLLIVVLMLGGTAFAQSTRLVLVEEFTGETCPPCAASNPGFNALLENFAGSVISLKYQNNIPSAGPNFYAYNTTDIANRTSYYANNYSPHAFLDGSIWDDNAASLTGAIIMNRTAVPSPFEIEVSHTFSPANDIIYVHATITATQAVSGSNLHARIAISERDVYGYTSPNGESEYSHVMRKLIPDGNGIALPNTWAAGDTMSLDYNWTITVPSNPNIDMPIASMLEAIVWIQEDLTKEIMQAGHSPAQITLDASAELLDVDVVTCNTNAVPSLTVNNLETGTITSMDIEYYVDAQTPSTYNWTGTINGGSSAVIALPAVTLTPGSHVTSANIVAVNGAPESVQTNNNATGNAGMVMPAVASYTQNFLPVNFTLMNWIIENPDNFITWARVSNTATPGSGGAKMDFYNSPPNQIDYLYNLNAIDLSTATAPQMTFKLAHKRYSAAYADQIDVMLSTDCGQTWTSVWMKSGSTLATVAGTTTSAYSPALADWRLETIDLTPYIGQNNVVIGFKATSDYGNNAYIDEVNITGAVSVNEINPSLFSMYPVPSNGAVTLSLDQVQANEFSVEVTSVDGKLVHGMEVSRTGNTHNMDLSHLNTGTYFVRITAANETSVKKIVIEK